MTEHDLINAIGKAIGWFIVAIVTAGLIRLFVMVVT